MATTTANKVNDTYNQNQNNANQWYNHLAAALTLGKSGWQGVLGYLIGNKLLKQPFEKWIAQIQGRVPDQQTQTPTTSTTFQDALQNAAQNIQNPTAFLADRANGVSNQQLANEIFPNKFAWNPTVKDSLENLLRF